eukprot:TRINITY_DN1679_c0_g1_i1.p1 TRINITY_DN1679_c0_g1~~TRINITY_DN1679_c0_g1_i1.p1  ORF type:complete len:930 (-),score=219.61 TRINITY_DN1679_c0_g1_i1:1317-4106(-)
MAARSGQFGSVSSRPMTPMYSPRSSTSAARSVVSSPRSHATGRSRGSDSSFVLRVKSVEELKQRVRRASAELEKKDAELRAVVGGHFRDVLAATESLNEMKTASQQVAQLMASIQCKLDELYVFRVDTGDDSSAAIQALQGSPAAIVGQRVKFIVDASEMIWSALDSGQILRAVDVALVASTMYTELKADTTGLLERFPVVHPKYERVLGLFSVIRDYCLRSLTDRQLSAVAVAQTVTSLCVLEQLPSAKALSWLLDSRLEWVSAVSAAVTGSAGTTTTPHSLEAAAVAEKHAAAPVEVSVILGQLQALMDTVRHTLDHVSALFVGDGKPPAVLSLLQQLSSERSNQVTADAETDSYALVRTPVAVRGLDKSSLQRLGSLNSSEWVSTSEVKGSLDTWLNACSTRIRAAGQHVLKRVQSCTQLAQLEAGLWKYLDEVEDGAWNQLCVETLGKVISLWSLLSDCFWERAKELVQRAFLSVDVYTMLQNTLSGIRKGSIQNAVDVARTLETDGATRSKPQSIDQEHKPLGLPVIGYVSFKEFERQMSLVADDVRHLLAERNSANHDRKKRYRAPLSELHEHTRESCQQLINGLCHTLKAHLVEQDNVAEDRHVQQILFVAHITTALASHSQTLRRALTPLAATNAPERESLALRTARDHLRTVAAEAGEIWCRMLGSKLCPVLVKISTTRDAWDAVRVDEDADGAAQAGTMRVPSQPSACVTSVLVALCREWCRVCPFGADDLFKKTALRAFVGATCATYDQLLATLASDSEKTSDAAFVQILLDVNVLSAVFQNDAGELTSIKEKVCQLIDPVDLVLYAPLVEQRAQAFVSGVASLLAPISRVSYSRATAVTPTNAVETNAFAKASVAVPRFNPLPVPATKVAGRAAGANKSRFSVLATLSKDQAATPQQRTLLDTVSSRFGLSFLDNVF